MATYLKCLCCVATPVTIRIMIYSSIREFKSALKQAFDLAESGEETMIERNGRRFTLKPEGWSREVVKPKLEDRPLPSGKKGTNYPVSLDPAPIKCPGHPLRWDCGRPGCKYA